MHTFVLLSNHHRNRLFSQSALQFLRGDPVRRTALDGRSASGREPPPTLESISTTSACRPSIAFSRAHSSSARLSIESFASVSMRNVGMRWIAVAGSRYKESVYSSTDIVNLSTRRARVSWFFRMRAMIRPACSARLGSAQQFVAGKSDNVHPLRKRPNWVLSEGRTWTDPPKRRSRGLQSKAAAAVSFSQSSRIRTSSSLSTPEVNPTTL